MSWRVPVLRVMLFFIFIINLFLGIMALSSQSLVLKAAEMVYGVKLAGLEPHTLYIVKMMGCFIIAIAIMAGLAVKDPINNKIVIYGNSIWLILRSLQRFFYIEQFHKDWGISYGALWGQAIFVLLVGVSLFLLIPKSEK